ncbi:MAG: ATP-binding protein [Elusimicrobiales bacterium]|nr:ATP-binding protein [Elusimicrobiales bacterium]
MEELKFSVDSALLSELGEKLVETVHVALVELVKNAYDADATLVEIAFLKETSGVYSIIIADNGIGMTLDEINKYWMKIATTNKVKNRQSGIYGRSKTGAKGIGRFCCRRLGTTLELETTARLESGDYQKTVVKFPWTKYSPGTDVTQIKCNGEVSTSKTGRTGTTLTISGATRDEWTERGFNFVKRQLTLLSANRGALRVGYSPDPGFNIKITADGESIETKDLREEIIESGWGTISGHVDSTGKAIYELDALRVGHKKTEGDRKFPELKGISFKVGIIPHVKEQLRNPKILSKKITNELLDEWSGIQIRLHGFRVFPYGEDDWLNIERDRSLSKSTFDSKNLLVIAKNLQIDKPGRAALHMLSNKSYFGQVELPDGIKGFEPKANREGFLANPAIDSLKEFVRYGIDWSTIYRAYFDQLETKNKTEKAHKEFTEVSGKESDSNAIVKTALNYIETEVENISRLIPSEKRQNFKKILSSVKTAHSAIISHETSSQEELRHLRLIASTSSLLLIFSHEVKSLLGMLESSRSIIKNIASRLQPKEKQVMLGVVESLEDSKQRFSELLGLTYLIGVDSKSAKEERLAIKEHISRATKCFDLIKTRYTIEISGIEEIPMNILVGPLLEAELFALLLNLLSNSIKSVIASGATHKKIHFEVIKEAKGTTLRVLDNGVGLSKANFEEAFIPFVSDPDKKLYSGLTSNLNPEDRGILGTGSGLGLTIVRDILKLRGGKIEFKTPRSGWKAQIEVSLP